MDLGIRGRRAIVCASRRGLGRACAEALARDGVDVTLNGRDPESLASAVESIRAQHAVALASVCGDIALHDARRPAGRPPPRPTAW